MSEGMFWGKGASNEIASPLSDHDRELRDLFVIEYLKDHDYKNAAIRVGFLPAFADQYAAEFATDPYVKKKIDFEMTRELSPEEEAEQKRMMKRRIDAQLMRQAMYKGPGASHGARVSALAKLASIYGMDAPTKVEQTVQHKGGVMMIPSAIGLGDWEAEAMASQQKLTSEAES